ncbi:restriction endonuclease subunit S [Pseudodesulfovibrio thermohalotolerans]|uniref:restriction endonuclease subunit S n=1 Tax=Pseudodesulfovibrio thermohalotolerans TaxID=2880651 RepID=UPI00244305A8|nr:restriction endonuclease subunit S [Pseudodesulfovibrio thermohalotolerans]WFS63066.1 restriction endonuclease subunit S [Pseudodesulfovibrio thermohalotolerans]
MIHSNESWKDFPLGEICENLDSKRIPITKAKRDSGSIPYYGASGIVDYVADYLFDEDLLLVSEDGANLLARTYPIAFSINGKTWVNNHAHVLRFKDYDSQRFVEYYLNSISLEPYVSGMAQPKLNQKKLNSIPVPFPPIPEQQRIVTILDDAFERIDAAIANTEKNLANARELLERTIESVFGDPYEQGWKESIVEELALKKKGSIRTGPFGSQLLHSEFVESGIAVLGIDNAVNNEFRWGKSRFITEEKYEQLERYTVKPGDVIITIMGTCGRCAIIPDDIPTAINTKHLCCISLDENRCSPEFLHAYFLHHPIARDYLVRKAKGAIMAGLNMGIIKKLPVMRPSLVSQEEIVIKIDTLKQLHADLEVNYQQKLNALTELKQSILQKAFAGELTAEMNQEALVN